jgi:hypothetical protein
MFDLIRSMRTRTMRGLVAAGLCSAALLSACGGGGGDSADNGTLHLSITDAPSCGYDAVNVTIQKIRVHQSTTANDTDSGWSEVVLSPAKRVDLLTLTNGVLEELGQTPLPAGKYQQMRLVLAANDSANPMANSVVPTGQSEVALTTPSGQQTGVKMNVDIDIAANKMADFVIDFDACKSVVHAGASGHYLLKPVVKVIPQYISGVVGYVDASLGGAVTGVSLQQAGVVVKATMPDSTGKFTLAPVAPGTYDLVVTSPGHATAVVTGVTVTTDTVTTLNAAASGINPPVSTTGTAAGAVTTGVSPIDAVVAVTQTLTAGSKIEVVSGPVDGTTGAYSDTLPTAAPVVAPYVALPGTLTFAADSAVAGKYGLAATSGGVTKTAGPITVGAGATVTTNFTFP